MVSGELKPTAHRPPPTALDGTVPNRPGPVGHGHDGGNRVRARKAVSGRYESAPRASAAVQHGIRVAERRPLDDGGPPGQARRARRARRARQARQARQATRRQASGGCALVGGGFDISRTCTRVGPLGGEARRWPASASAATAATAAPRRPYHISSPSAAVLRCCRLRSAVCGLRSAVRCCCRLLCGAALLRCRAAALRNGALHCGRRQKGRARTSSPPTARWPTPPSGRPGQARPGRDAPLPAARCPPSGAWHRQPAAKRRPQAAGRRDRDRDLDRETLARVDDVRELRLRALHLQPCGFAADQASARATANVVHWPHSRAPAPPASTPSAGRPQNPPPLQLQRPLCRAVVASCTCRPRLDAHAAAGRPRPHAPPAQPSPA